MTDPTDAEIVALAVSEGIKVRTGGGVATAQGYKFKTPEEAWDNAAYFVERCAEILRERRSAP